MNIKIWSLVILVTVANLALGTVIKLEVGGMTAVYTGWKGQMKVSQSVKDNTFDIELTDVPIYYDNKTDVTLIITAKNKRSGDNILINNIISDGALQTLQIDFSAGNGVAGCVRNIDVKGKIENLIINGGDLGDAGGMDGHVRINGLIQKLAVKGRRYNVVNSGKEFWGGNIWADLVVTGGIGSVEVKGGCVHGYGSQGTFGKIISGPNTEMSKFKVKGVAFKEDDGTKRWYGGSVSSCIETGPNKIGSMQVTGGTIYGTSIQCRQLQKLKVTGQALGKSLPFFPQSQQGIFNSRIGTYGETNFIYCRLNSIQVKNGNVQNTLVSSMQNINNFTVSGKMEEGFGNVRSTWVRSGFTGKMSDNIAPYLALATNVASVANDQLLVLPFVVTNGTPNEILTIRLHHRGPALTGAISNYLGQTFSGTNFWKTSNNVVSGMFIWVAGNCPNGTYTNLMIRALDDGVPRKYKEFNVRLRVTDDEVSAQPILASNNSPQNNTVPNLSYAGNLKTINVAGQMFDSVFLSGIKEVDGKGWQGASYLGKMNTMTVKNGCFNSVFCSRKDFTISKKADFDFLDNQIWVNGVREQD